MDIENAIAEIQEKFGVVGRDASLRKLILGKQASKHIIIEGPVGVGKTTLAHAVAAYFDQGFIRIDGDERYTESKLVGHFEPPLVVEKGWIWDAFVPGPLTLAMKNGSILFINEANRLIEGTQNVLLPSMDEGLLILPKLGVIKAADGFLVVATQNPESYIGTTVLSEALKDRFVWIKLEHQGFEEEVDIVEQKADIGPEDRLISETATKITRATRKHPDIRRGSSIRGAIDLAKILHLVKSLNLETVSEMSIMTLATKIELEDGVERPIEDVIHEIVEAILSGDEDRFL
ncbi:MAG: MoxR family ATPase [Candidatus Heimdallarchaeota archaeon]|nr:MAG: MoxR family ATPase [Candidatus Heimdallarchaeota archaeon]